MPIDRLLDDNATFDQAAIEVMSDALEKACTALHIDGEIRDRQIVAERIISLAGSGVVDPKALSDRVVAETQAMRSL